MAQEIFKQVCDFFGSQRKVAEILGCTPAFVGHVYHGRRPMPDIWAPILERASEGKFTRAQLAPNSPWVLNPESHTKAKSSRNK